MNEILSYQEMCAREQYNLQRGMNFRCKPTYSIILMSVRANAPYRDAVLDDGATLIYEGHDEPNTAQVKDPKHLDQPEFTPHGRLTQNGKFHEAAQNHKRNGAPPELVRVYEKIKSGIWSYNGVFHLVDSWQEHDGRRQVFRFKLVAAGEDEMEAENTFHWKERQRIIPTDVKLAVWKRDGGKCVECGATDELHFDHIIPYSRGGTSLRADNVQLLCARHNLQKSDQII